MISRKEVRKIKQIIVRVSDEIHQQLKLKTLQDNISIQELLSGYIERYLSQENKEDVLLNEAFELLGYIRMAENGANGALKHLKNIFRLYDKVLLITSDEEYDTEKE